MKTGFASVKLALAGFIVPFMFVYNQALLLESVSFIQGVQVAITACVGVFLIALAAEGYLFTKVVWPLRILSFATALLLIDSAMMTDIIGIVSCGLIVLAQYVIKQRKEQSLKPA